MVNIVGLVLDIACFKWIKIAHALFYVELLHTVLVCMVPFELGLGASQMIIVLALIASICLYSKPL